MKKTIEITIEQYEEYQELKHADEILRRIHEDAEGIPLEEVEAEILAILDERKAD